MRQGKRSAGFWARMGAAGLMAGALLLSSSGAFAAGAAPRAGAHGLPPLHPHGPYIAGDANAKSTNWSGYAAATNLSKGATGSVTDVQGQWVIPQMKCGPDGWSSAWVGIDGFNSHAVE